MGGFLRREFGGQEPLIKRVTYAKRTLQGDLRTNVPVGGRNAVTWGVFPGHEIAQSTIIERDSFLSWKVRANFFSLSYG